MGILFNLLWYLLCVQDQDFSQNRSASDNNQSAMMMNQMNMGSNNMGQGMGYNNSMMGKILRLYNILYI